MLRKVCKFPMLFSTKNGRLWLYLVSASPSFFPSPALWISGPSCPRPWLNHYSSILLLLLCRRLLSLLFFGLFRIQEALWMRRREQIFLIHFFWLTKMGVIFFFGWWWVEEKRREWCDVMQIWLICARSSFSWVVTSSSPPPLQICFICKSRSALQDTTSTPPDTEKKSKLFWDAEGSKDKKKCWVEGKERRGRRNKIGKRRNRTGNFRCHRHHCHIFLWHLRMWWSFSFLIFFSRSEWSHTLKGAGSFKAQPPLE